jgi:hypothetical protein
VAHEFEAQIELLKEREATAALLTVCENDLLACLPQLLGTEVELTTDRVLMRIRGR